MRLPSPRTSGCRTRRERARLLALLLAAGCNYGFQGGGFPPHVRTLYIEPVQNETSHFELEQELSAALLQRLPGALGVTPAARDNADAIVQVRIIGYDDQAQNYTAGGSTGDARILERQVQVTLSVRIIDATRDPPVVLWSSRSLVGRGQYSDDTQSDQVGRQRAIEHLLQQIVDGAQSQW